MKLLLIRAVVFASGLLLAQDTNKGRGTSTAPGAAPAISSIEGTIIDTLTRQPVGGAVVSARVSGNPVVARADRQGRYAIPGLPPGTYLVNATNEGYVAGMKRLRIVAAQVITGLDFSLDPEAVLAGRVVNRDGSAIIGASISVKRFGYRQGRPALMSIHSARTNDLGEFRIPNLRSGRYYLEVLGKPLQIRKALRNNNKESEPLRAPVSTYYPASRSASQATLVPLRAGERREGLEVTLLSLETVCVSSELGDTGGEMAGAIEIGLSEIEPGWEERLASASSLAPGDYFEICGLPAGDYRLWAFTADSKRPLQYASSVFSVGDRAVRVLPLYLARSHPVKGTVTVAETHGEPTFPSPLEFALEPSTRMQLVGESTSAVVEKPGSFIIPAALPGEYWLRVFSLPTGFYVKKASLGTQDALSQAVRIGDDVLEILLGADGPSVSGSVADRDGNAVPDATVALVRADWEKQSASSPVLTATSDQNGSFSVTRIAPGRYHAMAFAALPSGDVGTPEFIRAAMNGVKTEYLDLSPGQAQVLKLTISDVPLY